MPIVFHRCKRQKCKIESLPLSQLMQHCRMIGFTESSIAKMLCNSNGEKRYPESVACVKAKQYAEKMCTGFLASLTEFVA